MSEEHTYFVSYYYVSPGGVFGYGRINITMRNKVSGIEDIKMMEETIKAEGINIEKAIVLNWIKYPKISRLVCIWKNLKYLMSTSDK